MTTVIVYRVSNVEGHEAAGELLRALAAPLRIRIVTELAGGPDGGRWAGTAGWQA